MPLGRIHSSHTGDPAQDPKAFARKGVGDEKLMSENVAYKYKDAEDAAISGIPYEFITGKVYAILPPCFLLKLVCCIFRLYRF